MSILLFVVAVVCGLLSWGLSVVAFERGRPTAGISWLLFSAIILFVGMGFLVS